MPLYSDSFKTISRTDGRSATAAAAYRSGEKVIDERNGLIHDYTRKAGVVFNQIIVSEGSPEWATDRSRLWSEVEFSETRKNSTVARELLLALPHEMTHQQRAELVLQIAHELVKKHGVALEVSIHAPDKEGDQRNFHVHILMSTRRLTPDGFTDKTREFDDRKQGSETVLYWRERWAQIQNEHLERAGIEGRVTHLSLEAQGIDRAPTAHMGPAVTSMTRRGESTDHQDREAARQAESAARAVQQAQLEIDRLNTLMAELQAQAAAEAEQEALQRKQEHEQAVKLSEQAFMARTGWDVVDDNHDDDVVDAPETLSERASRLRAESDRLLSVVREYRRRPQKPDIEDLRNNHKIKIQMLTGDIKSFSISDINSMLENAESNLNNQLYLHSKKGLIGQLFESKELKEARQKHIEINDLLNQVAGIVSSDKVENIINYKYNKLAEKYNQEAIVYNAWENESRGHEEADRLAREAELEARLEQERLNPELAHEINDDLGMSL